METMHPTIIWYTNSIDHKGENVFGTQGSITFEAYRGFWRFRVSMTWSHLLLTLLCINLLATIRYAVLSIWTTGSHSCRYHVRALTFLFFFLTLL